MTEEPVGYRPFPSIVGWCEDLDTTVVDAYTELLTQAKETSAPEALDRAVTIATRYAAVDTGAIEGLYTTNRGFTRTIAEQTATWQKALRQRGELVERSINDALAGYEMVLDAVTRAVPITEAWIRRLHEVLCASQETYQVITAIGPQQQPLTTGSYKALPNNPTNADTGRMFHYASVEDTPVEMARLVREITSPAFAAAHPVVQAAYAHYAFVRVHPFADGNGRVARALASVFLYRHPGVPLVIFADQKDAYLDALEAADGGRPRSFVAFVGERIIDTIQLVRLSLDATLPLESAERLRATLADHPLVSRPLELAAPRVLDRLSESTLSALGQLQLPDGVGNGTRTTGPADPPPPGYLDVVRRSVEVFLFLDRPVAGQQGVALTVWVNERAGAEPALLATGHPRSSPLELLSRDVVPTISTVTDLKMRHWCGGQVALLIEDFEQSIAERLDRK